MLAKVLDASEIALLDLCCEFVGRYPVRIAGHGPDELATLRVEGLDRDREIGIANRDGAAGEDRIADLHPGVVELADALLDGGGLRAERAHRADAATFRAARHERRVPGLEAAEIRHDGPHVARRPRELALDCHDVHAGSLWLLAG